MKVAVVSIMKNEAKHVARWAESCKDADYRILLDTGSTDDSVTIAEACGVTVHHKVFNPWRFDHARNYLLDLIPDDVDWIFNLDVDEVFGEGWYQALAKMPNDGSVNRPRYIYTWNWESFMVNDDGSVDIQETIRNGKPGLTYQGDKCTRRFTHRWKGACHEVNITEPGNQELQAFCEGLRVYHFADNTKSRGGYLDLLILDVEEDPTNARNTYYLGREFMYRGMAEQSINMLKHHLSLETAWWKPERGFACRYIARQVPEHEKYEWLLKSVAEYPTGRECWLELAQWAHDRNRWLDCYWAAKKALEQTNRGDLYLTEARSWGWMPHDLAALASYRLGMYEEALMHGKNALSYATDDERLKKNLFYYKNALSKIDVVIPTKTNASGLQLLISQLLKEPKVDRILVVGDGEEGRVLGRALPPSVSFISVPSESGIHVMWNHGLDLVKDNHVAFINDDVKIEPGTMDKLCAALDANDDYGLVCPVYWDGGLTEDRITTTTCRGRYDGTGGIAGFCFVLAADVAQNYRFDERMTWWYGDDDVVRSVDAMGKSNVIVSGTRIFHEHSKTIKSSPPKAFAELVEQDRVIYERKWGDNA